MSINKYLFYATFSVLFMSLSLLGFYKYSLDISISKHLIEAIFEVSLLVSVDLISIPFIGYLLFIGVVLYFIFKQYKKIVVNQLKSPLIILAFLGIATYFSAENYRFGTFKNRLPYIAFNSVVKFFQEDNLLLLPVDDTTKSTVNDINFVFILGESVRADHIQLNGYSRETSPKLSKRKNIISYSDLYTPLTHTVASVKQLLTNQSVDDAVKSNEVYSLFSILNTVGYKTSWIGNSTIVKSYAPIILSNQNVQLIDKFRSILSFNKALDEKMLQPFDSILKTKKNQFITLHMVGSHWWYENRYSDEFRKFTPVINSKHIPSLEPQEIINSYDNTLLYLDNFIDVVINSVEKTHTKSIVMYVADHGEILGEDGKWLHAQESEASKNPAMIIWYSDEFITAYPNLVSSLKEKKDKRISADFFYHSILDLFQVQNFDYETEKSIFRSENNEPILSSESLE
ncbi:MAG: phosphoethanolamine transferase [Flavobacteriaceae bacterium]|nr:phosphoethanolamine transferase [Flavobacteriaceae bacterium]